MPRFNCTEPLAPLPNDLAEMPVSIPCAPAMFKFVRGDKDIAAMSCRAGERAFRGDARAAERD